MINSVREIGETFTKEADKNWIGVFQAGGGWGGGERAFQTNGAVSNVWPEHRIRE